MNSEIEKLIDLAIADGQITEKERNVILRKAAELGVDLDEVEMVLDGKLHKLEASKPKQKEKVGNIKTCPACGSSAGSFTSKCADCGHEFFNTKTESSINSLFELLLQIEKEERNKPKTNINLPFGVNIDSYWSWEDELALAKRQASTIRTFPVPNNKEALLEFLALGLPQTNTKIKKGLFGLVSLASEQPKLVIKQAWQSKCQQIIIKSRITFKDDNEAMSTLNLYSKKFDF
jgi:hypothetical protein